jgi:hypothetical protein
VEAGSQANERVEKGEVRVLDEEGILVKTGGQENDFFVVLKAIVYIESMSGTCTYMH